MSLIVKIITLTLILFSLSATDKTILLKYFNGTAIVTFFRIALATFGAFWATVFPNDLALYLKDWKLSVFAISKLKSVTLSLELNHKLPVVLE